MNDQLKKYVQHHREDFDDLEPDDAVFLKIKDQIKPQLVTKEKNSLLTINYKWLVAATILVVFSISYLLLTYTEKNHKLGKGQIAQVNPPLPAKNQHVEKMPIESITSIAAATITSSKKSNKKRKQAHHLKAIYEDLADSTSASTRLAAILKIRQSEVMNTDIIDRLAKTLNNDANSNVRLAALDVAGKYAKDEYVSQVFVQSLSDQKDPLVQLELINLLSHTNDSKLDEKLYALVNNPETPGMVRDQAYMILLNQNKL